MTDSQTPLDGHPVRRDHEWRAAVVGGLLVIIGAAMLAERTGLLALRWRSVIWPLLLMAFGVARLLQPTSHGREGTFFVLAGAWWYAGLSGWISLATTWPLLIVALGASIVVQSLTTPRRDPGGAPFRHARHSGAMPLVLIAIVAGALISGEGRDWSVATSEDAFHVVSIMGRSQYQPTGQIAREGDALTIMGRSSVDFRQATAAPSTEVSVQVMTVMGATVIYVPDDWTVDVSNVTAFGQVRDTRAQPTVDLADAAPGAAASPGQPRVRVRGAIVMGTLVIASQEQSRRRRS